MSTEELHLRDVLAKVYQDVCRDELYEPSGDGNHEKKFVDHYTMQEKDKKHPTHYLLTLSLDFHSDRSYRYSCKISQEFFKWLDARKPTFDLGEVDGKHSDVKAYWHSFVTDDDFYRVEARGEIDEDAELFGSLYNTFMREKGEPLLQFCKDYLETKFKNGDLVEKDRVDFCTYYTSPLDVVWGGGRDKDACIAYIDDKIAKFKRDRKDETEEEEENAHKKRKTRATRK